ncbi:MAG TPA: T9SS type A sorting domain-containing protein [Chitinophagaceae bacterium]|nr:T9SS type A sorting domain-containing protein [Chitinophagaceae bacterium]
MQKFHSIIRFTLLVLFLGLSIVINAQPCPGQNPRIQRVNANISPRIQSYMEYLPLDYITNPTATYPVIIYWAGQGELFDFCTLLSNSLPKVINDGNFPNSVTDNTSQSYSYIVIAPMMNNTQNMNNVFEADAVLDYVKATYRDNPNRIYMTGISFGSYLLMDYASSTLENARTLAAISPVANCFPNTVPDFNVRAGNLGNGNVSLWGLQCDADAECSPSWIQGWVNGVNAIDPTQAMYTPVGCVPAGSHYAWDLVYNPNFRVNGRNIYEWLILSAQSAALPVTLKNYTARLQSDRVIVEWTTTNESNADRFILERAGANQEFKAIAETPAAGNSLVDKKYSLVDDQPHAGISYYRLSLVNMDGKKDYFEVKRLNNPKSLPGKVSIPNPAKGTLDIYVNLDKRERIHIQLFDLNGRLLKEVKKDFYPGVSENKIDVSTLTHGTYLVKVVGETVTVNRKIIIN